MCKKRASPIGRDDHRQRVSAVRELVDEFGRALIEAANKQADHRFRTWVEKLVAGDEGHGQPSVKK